jgi:hypothetical protein
MVKILLTDNLMDFSAPIYISPEDKKKLISFLKNLDNVNFTLKEVHEKERYVGERKSSSFKKWDEDDLFDLLSPMSNEEIAEKTGRSSMSIIMQRGHFIANFKKWFNSKGIKDEINKNMIKKYLSENK